ncbi:MAG TPA: tetratricopeptide repeat protein [bacterium]|mgnify:CR=1 FL=1|nr:tetratricopeptide repeat protein [bacterium]
MKGQTSKIVTVSLLLNDINQNRQFFRIPDNIKGTEELKNYILQRYKPLKGILEGFVDNKRLIVQWYPEDVDDEAEKYHLKALQLSKKKEYLHAIQCWEKSIQLNSGDVEYLYKLGLVYFEMKKFREALGYLKNAIEICPIHYRSNLLMGISLTKLRKFGEAEKYIIESNILNRSNILTYLNLGAIYSIQKRFNEAIDMFNTTIKISPNEARAYLGLAKIYIMLNDIDAANSYLSKVIEMAPGTTMAEYARRSIRFTDDEDKTSTPSVESRQQKFTKGLVGYLSGQYESAASEYKGYLNTHPNDDYAWYLYGETRLRTGDLNEASDCFKRAVRIRPNRSLYHKSMGVTFYLSGKTHEGMQALKKTLELGKKDPLTLTLMGVFQLRMKHVDESIELLESALRLNPNNPLAMYHLALAHLRKEDRKKAVQIVDDILAFDFYLPIKHHAKNLKSKISASEGMA